MEIIYFIEISGIHFIRSSTFWGRKPLSWRSLCFTYSVMQIWEFIRDFSSFLLPSLPFNVYLLQTNLHTTNSLSNLAASAHKSNISLFHCYAHVSDTVFSISWAKRIPIPVSLESEKYQAWCSLPTKQRNPIQASELCITQTEGRAHCFKRVEFFFLKARLGTGKQIVLCVQLCHNTRRDKGLSRKYRK